MRQGKTLIIMQYIAKRTTLLMAGALLIGVIANSFQSTKAEENQTMMRGNEGSLSITLNNSGPCSAFNVVNNSLNIDVISGGIASNCFAVAASTTSAAGYTLDIAGSDELKTNDNLVIKPTTGTMENPTTFASPHTGGVWGFAISNDQIYGLDLGFDTSYQVLASNNTTNTARYAAVPTIPTAFSQTSAPNTTPDIYNIFLAVATGQNIPTGEYSGVVTVSGFMNAMPVFDCNAPDTSFDTGCTDNNVSVVMPTGMVGVRYTGSPNAPEWTVSGPTDPLWYHYTNKEWANAVTFETPTNRNLPVGTVLNQAQLDDILGYWVYIPRFEYRLINTGFDGESHCGPDNLQHCPQAFDVRFVSNLEPVRIGIQIGDWHTHPAFMIDMNGDGGIDGDNENVAGLWMAKYEASLDQGFGANCIVAGEAGCNVTLNPNGARASTFVPMVSPWTNINLLNIHQNAQNIPAMHGIAYSNQLEFIVNGLTNASWGAAAYLSQSLYGLCTNQYCSRDGTRLTTADGPNMQKIHNNGHYNNWGASLTENIPIFITGCGPNGTVQNPTDIHYNTANCAGRAWHTEIGMLASSNHNATGIFDLAGGVMEHTFSARARDYDIETFSNWLESGFDDNNFNFNRFSDLMYFDIDFRQCPNCFDDRAIQFGSFAGLSYYFGLALAETIAHGADPSNWAGDWNGGWGRDVSIAPSDRFTAWFTRGGEATTWSTSGVFAFHPSKGEPFPTIGWRAVIAGS